MVDAIWIEIAIIYFLVSLDNRFKIWFISNMVNTLVIEV
jgi:hypothetical protein